MGAIFSASGIVVKVKSRRKSQAARQNFLIGFKRRKQHPQQGADRDYNDRTDKEEDQNLTNYLFNRIHIPHSFLNHPVFQFCKSG